jgi:hypothetical protein
MSAMTEISGQEVALPAQAKFYMPSQCCRCGKPGVKQLTSSIAVTGFGRKTRSVTFPYCGDCATRLSAITKARTVLFMSCLGIALGLSCLGFLVPALPKVVLWGVPTMLAVVAAIVLRARAGESVEMPRGAWLSKATSKVTIFFMTNGDWAKEFAAGNQIPALTPVVRKERWLVWPWMLGVAGIAAIVVAVVAQPDVYVDNAMPGPVQIWIDGKKSIVASSTIEPLGPRASVSVAYGTHRFGWSPVGAAAPVAQTEPVKVEIAGDHLYNPDQSACYYLERAVYGTDTGKGVAHGPVLVQEFYSFKRIDSWFAKNPHETSSQGSGATRVALQGWPRCHELTTYGCGLDVRRDYMTCLRKSVDAEEGVAGEALCVTAAAKQCGVAPKK